jgi:hypothetical protein
VPKWICWDEEGRALEDLSRRPKHVKRTSWFVVMDHYSEIALNSGSTRTRKSLAGTGAWKMPFDSRNINTERKEIPRRCQEYEVGRNFGTFWYGSLG